MIRLQKDTYGRDFNLESGDSTVISRKLASRKLNFKSETKLYTPVQK